MPFVRDGNEIFEGDLVVLAPSAARTASGSAAPIAMGDRTVLRLDLSVTAASGTTPTMTARIEHSPDGDSWSTHTSFTQATGASSQRKVLSGLDRFVRAAWTIGGTTPSFTFAVSGEAV